MFTTPPSLPGSSSEKQTTATSAPAIVRKLHNSNELLNIKATELQYTYLRVLYFPPYNVHFFHLKLQKSPNVSYPDG